MGKKCKNCGAIVESESEYCPKCDTAIKRKSKRRIAIIASIIIDLLFIATMLAYAFCPPEPQEGYADAKTSIIIVSVFLAVALIIEIWYIFFGYKRALKEYETKRLKKEALAREEAAREELKRQRQAHEKAAQEELEKRTTEINALCEKYYCFVQNFINSYHKRVRTFSFPNMIKSHEWSSNSYVHKLMLRDGIDSALENISEANEYTDEFIRVMREKLKEEWNHSETLECVIYIIIRNGWLKDRHDWYVKNIGYETLEEFCFHSTRNYAQRFAIYKLYETDVTAPLGDTLQDLEMQIEDEFNTFEKLKKKKAIRDEIFNTDFSEELTATPLKKNKQRAITIEDIDQMTGREFEYFVAKLFRGNGYKVMVTPEKGDYGVDVIAENNLVKIGIQAKCYSDKVDSAAVREIVTGLKHYGLNLGMVITNNYFQPSAIQLAKDNGIKLWNRNDLIGEIAKINLI